MKKILIDMSSAIPYFRNGVVFGVGRSVVELVRYLNQIKDLPFEIELYTQSIRNNHLKDFVYFDHLHIPLPKRFFFDKLLSILRIKKMLSKYDIYHIPHNTDLCEIYSKTIFTIHDLIVYRYPEYWNTTEKEKERFRDLANKCKAIVTCSEASKKDLMKYWNVPSDKVTVIYWGINRNVFYPVKDNGWLATLGITGLYYFCASCNHKRKNLPLLLEAFRLYIENGGLGQLVLLNPIQEPLCEYKDLISKNKIILCYKCPDSDLAMLYSNARCSIILSQYEGFGFPVLESLSCGTMVLSSRNSSLEEIGKNYIEYIEKFDKKEIADKLLLYDVHKPSFDYKNIEKYLKSFSWERCAREYVEFYKKQLDIN